MRTALHSLLLAYCKRQMGNNGKTVSQLMQDPTGEAKASVSGVKPLPGKMPGLCRVPALAARSSPFFFIYFQVHFCDGISCESKGVGVQERSYRRSNIIGVRGTQRHCCSVG